jgi:anti-anti-sigma regulatory factor
VGIGFGDGKEGSKGVEQSFREGKMPAFDLNDGLLDANGGLSHWRMPRVARGLIVYAYGCVLLGHNELLAHFERLTSGGFKHFIFDFRSCWAVDNSWPGCLAQFTSNVKAGGGYLYISSLTPGVRRVFEGVGFLPLFDPKDSVHIAIEDLKGILGIPTLEQELSALRRPTDNAHDSG